MALDQDVVNLAKSIRQVETGNRAVSGASGELKSRYQYMPATWKSTAAKYLGDPNAELTNINENKATYLKIKDWKDQGFRPDQIASMWNSGRPEWEGNIGTNSAGVKYDVPAYVKKVGAEYQKRKGPQKTQVSTSLPGPSLGRQQDIATAQQASAIFTPNTQNPSLIAESAKTIGNIPSSAFGFVKGALDMINPVSTFNKLKSIPGEIKSLAEETAAAQQAGADVDAGQLTREGLVEGVKELVPKAIPVALGGLSDQFLGTDFVSDEELQQSQRDIVTDPVGQIAPYLLLGKGAAEKVGLGKQFDAGISKIARPVSETAKNIKGKVTETARFAGSQATGLQPSTLEQISKNPEAFSKPSRATIDRAALGKEVQSALAKRLETVKETGDLYNPIRKSTKSINIIKNWLTDTIKTESGLTLVKGKWKGSPGSKLRASSDVRAIQSLYDNFQPAFKKGKMTPNEFLNFRADLAELSKFERQIGKSKPVEGVTKSTRSKFNKDFRKQVKGLAELDKQFGPQISELKTLSKGIVNKEGNLTDSAINRIANATGKGKDFVLQRLEETSPGITQKIRVLKAVEDIQNASGIKVGTYSRAALAVGVGFGLGAIQAIVAAILTSPEIAVPLLRKYGVLKNANVVRAIMDALQKVNRIPESLQVAGGQDLGKIKEPVTTPSKLPSPKPKPKAFSPKDKGGRS